jgi:hypothetical protein
MQADQVRTPAVVRETAQVNVGSSSETWRLEWTRPPQPYCSVDDGGWFTCPCEGLAFGEKGPLDLVRRLHDGVEERIPLNPLFPWPDGGREVVLKRWDVEESDHSLVEQNESALLRRLESRPAARAMQFVDYDHDGRATEFLLHVEPLGCGHPYSVVVGISQRKPQLHVFATVEHPSSYLALPDGAWLALSRSPSPTRVPEWACGDHGESAYHEVEVWADAAGIHATRRTYECTTSGKRGRLLTQDAL